jgi:3-oxoacyl-[acyl-carrier-protein] synthase-1/3-oxoacyl-[acyl-carrier-protein] synthase II
VKPVVIVASGVVSPLGEGPRAFGVGQLGERPISRVTHDPGLEAAGLRRPNVARAALRTPPNQDRACALLRRALELLFAELHQQAPGWQGLRIGVALGTSSGGLGTLTEVLSARARREPISAEQARAASYFGPLSALEPWSFAPTRLTQVLSACASSTVAMGVGCRWLEAGSCDLVLAGGYDALTLFAAAGFEALGATTAEIPRPFRQDRDGLALGEGAALVALMPAPRERALGYVLGFGLGCDAVHITAPDRSGSGLARAARAALADAELEPERVDLISAHATATAFNDNAEAHAIATVIGPTAERVVVHPFKAVVGHTLGAAGTLETLAALDAAQRGLLPGALGDSEIDGEFTARLCTQNMPGNAAHVLKLSTAFGGANAALIVSPSAPRRPAPVRAAKRVRLRALGEPQISADLALIAGFASLPALELERLDAPSALTLSAIASVLGTTNLESRQTCGVVVGTMSATVEVNEAFALRLRERGPRGAEPRRFPVTSPNLAPGRAAIAFGLQGPSLSVGSGALAALEALLLGIELLQAGDAEALFVVAMEDVGPVVRELWALAGLPLPEQGAIAALLDTGELGMPLEIAPLAAQLCEERGGTPELAPGWPMLKRALRSGRA